jgi:hypothetical protein
VAPVSSKSVLVLFILAFAFSRQACVASWQTIVSFRQAFTASSHASILASVLSMLVFFLVGFHFSLHFGQQAGSHLFHLHSVTI